MLTICHLRSCGGALILGRMEIQRPIDIDACSTWLEIDLGAIKNNLNLLTKLTGRPVMPVVKANAYGHGLIEVSKAAVEAGVGWLGVARIEEALTLRAAGVACKILVLGYTPPKQVGAAVQEGISLTVYDKAVAESYADEAAQAGGSVSLHVKVDSGMGRLGVFPRDAVDFVRWLKGQRGLDVEAIFTHFARADETKYTTTDEQIKRFDDVLKELEKEGIKPRLVHAANSAGTLNYPAGRYDLARCGIVMYGLQPSPDSPLPEGFIPALSWKTHLVSLKTLPPGHGVSYNFQYFTQKNERIGAIAIGYADGFRRRAGNIVLVRGKRVPVVGAVCMDQCMVQLDDVPEARLQDEVVLIGRQGDEMISADELAKDWGTINYEVLCGLADRVPRIYLK
jgi:alanine racemase